MAQIPLTPTQGSDALVNANTLFTDKTPAQVSAGVDAGNDAQTKANGIIAKKPAATVATVAAAIAAVDAGTVEVGDLVDTEQYSGTTGLGGNRYIVRENASRPAEDGGSVIYCARDKYLEGMFIDKQYTARRFGAVGDGSSDDALSLRAWIDYGNSTGRPLYLESGCYIYSQSLGVITRAFEIFGDGKTKSILKATPDFTGWTLIVRETGFVVSGWNKSQLTYDYDNEVSGVSWHDFSMSGDRTSGALQGGVRFHDRNDNVNFSSVWIHFYSMGGFENGILDTRAVSYVRESDFYDVQIRMCGNRDYPAMTLSGSGTGDSTNQVNFYGLKVVWPFGEGLVIKNDSSTTELRRVYFYGCMLHGQEDSILTGKNMLTVKGAVSAVYFYGLRCNSSEIGAYAFSIEQYNSEYPTNIKVDLNVTTGYGGGINVAGGRNHRISVSGLFVDGDEISLGADISGLVDIQGSLSTWSITGDQTAIDKWLSNSSSDAIPFRSESYVVGVGSAIESELFAVEADPEGLESKPPGSIAVNRTASSDTRFSCNSAFIKAFGTGATNWRAIQQCVGNTTGNRPSAPTLYQYYFDTGLNKPIWWSGSGWVDSTGAAV